MGNFGYRNERNGFRFVIVLVALLVLCVVVAFALVKELSSDFRDNNQGNQSAMNETDTSNEDEDEDASDEEDDTSNEDDEQNHDSSNQQDEENVDINDNDGKLVIIIDAGHDAYHVGAEGNGIDEEKAVLTIAQACYEELCKYDGVEVYMTRTDMTCPGGGKDTDCTATKCNAARVEFADSVDADAFISLHLNVLEDTSFGGAIVYYPNKNYVERFHEEGKELSECIMEQLVDLGLADRGVRTQDSKDNSKYPDGSLADYYGIIRGSKSAGILAVIVEHAFVSNEDDVKEFLNTEEKLKELGIADAIAIAEYYGLEKK